MQNIYHDGSLSLHTRSLKYGKLGQGCLLKVPYPTKKSFKVRISLAGFVSKFWKSLRLQLSTQFLSFLILEIDQFSVPIKHIPVPTQCVFCNYRGRYRNTTLIRRNCGTSPPVGNGTNKLLHFFFFFYNNHRIDG